jgi:hypothetical protein
MTTALLVLALAAPDVGELLKSLGADAKAGRWSKVARQVRELEMVARREAPLEVTDGQALAAPAEGLGIYKPLEGGVVRASELFLYAQVANHGLRAVEGGYELHLVSDLIVLTEDGTEIARDSGFGESRFTAKAPHRDTFVNVALKVTGLPKGKYRIKLVIHDKVSEKVGSTEIPFAMP